MGGDDDEVVPRGGVEELLIREEIDANGVEARVSNEGEILFGTVVAFGREGPVGDGAQKVRLPIEMEVFAVNLEAHGGSLQRTFPLANPEGEKVSYSEPSTSNPPSIPPRMPPDLDSRF